MLGMGVVKPEASVVSDMCFLYFLQVFSFNVGNGKETFLREGRDADEWV